VISIEYQLDNSGDGSVPATAYSAPTVRRRIRALDARRTIDLIALRIAPALSGALIILSHAGLGRSAVVFAAMLVAGQLLERARFPLALVPTARIALAMLTPLIGVAGASILMTVLGAGIPLADLSAAVMGSWLVLALGAWIRYRVAETACARIAVIGAREFAVDLAREFDAAGIRDHKLMGWIGQPGPDGNGLAWLGTLRNVREAVLAGDIELLVCAPGDDLNAFEDRAVVEAVADFCLDLPVRMIGANQLYEQLLGHVPIGTIDSAWYRYIMHPRFRSISPTSKRAFDLAGSTLIAALFAPFLLGAALAVKLSDGGKVIYRQRRVGEHGREFEILKLRTMREDAEADGAARWATRGDARVTRVGRVLRRTHLDELPQLINVIRGDMTLVGPRPERPEMVAQIEGQFPHYARRHLVKPGIAGWAQLRCGYAGSDLGTAWKLCHDLYYVKHRSVLGDALILFETGVEAFRDAHRSLRSPSERFLLSELSRESGG